MTIFLLTPTDVESDHWRWTTYKGEVLVRAKSERQARALVDIHFTGADMSRLPWRLPELVTCETVGDWEGETVGKVEVLHPVHHPVTDRRREAEYFRALAYQAEHQTTDLRTLGGIIHNHLQGNREVVVAASQVADGVGRITDWANEVKETGAPDLLPKIAPGLRKIAAELERQATHVG